MLPEDLYLPIYTYSAEEIFKNNILLFNVDFFGEEIKIQQQTDSEGNVEYYYYKNDKGEQVKTSKQDMAATLKKTISSWYNGLRNICIVLMLSVLVYIGIRMLLSSVAADKAKYVTMLKDWFIGLCLLFLMHYIMAFSVFLVNKLTDVVKTSVEQNAYVVVLEDEDGKISEKVEELGQGNLIEEAGGTKVVSWPTNLMGYLRTQLQAEDYGMKYVGYGICFLILCLFTLYFTTVYFKRVLHMAFLTLIAPMVALTYCIDKINDGQAQGFNKWFKEYIFNLLIQPMHLLLYYILVTSAFDLAGENVVYSIVALGFMIPAEKLLRSLFGFEKASTAPAMGPAGAMMASTALNNFLNRGKKGGAGKSSGSNEENSLDKVPNSNKLNPIEQFSGYNNEDSQEENDDVNTMPIDNDHDEDSRENETKPSPLNDGKNPNKVSEDAKNKIIIPTTSESLRRQQQQAMERERQRKAKEELEKKKQEEANKQEPIRQAPINQKAGAKSKIKGFGRGVARRWNANMAANKANARMLPGKLKNKVLNSHPVEKVGKMAAGAIVGGSAAMAGMAIAASTGDLGNVAKIGLAAGATGYAVGYGKVDSIKSPMDDPKVQGVYNDTYNKDEYAQEDMSKYVKDFLKDARNRNYFEQKYNKKEAKKMLQAGGEVEQYLNNDITDLKEMAAIHNFQKAGHVNSIEEGIAVSQFHGMMGGADTTKMKKKERGEWTDTIADMAKKNKNIKNTKKFAEDRMAQIDQFSKIRKKV